jgi:hypothetical protein
MKTFTPAGFASFLVHELGGAGWKHMSHSAIEQAAKMIKREAKSLIGTPQLSWPPLAESTAAHKRTGASAPLFETGERRSSIDYVIISDDEAEIGSNLEKAVWQEMGTSKIPPRSFLALAA